jgi:cell wall-associated NlpC family hydrolase
VLGGRYWTVIVRSDGGSGMNIRILARACAVLGISTAAVVLSAGASASASTVSGTLTAGHSLTAGQSIAAGRYRATMQRDGNFVEYGPRGATWSTRTNGTGATKLAMQADGNVVLYAGHRAVWASRTKPGAHNRLVVQTDGNLVVYNGANTALWAKGRLLRRAADNSTGARIITIARSYLGTPYGGQFDCSGYTQVVYHKAGVANLIHNAEAQREHMRLIPGAQARPGDLIFYMDGGSAYHVAIFAGGRMQYAANVPGGSVVYQGIWSDDIEFGTDWH